MTEQYDTGYFCNNCKNVWKENMDECPCGMPNLVPVKVKTLENGDCQIVDICPADKPELEDEMKKRADEVIAPEKKKVKLGERFIWQNEHEVSTMIAENKLTIKPGDHCFIGMANGMMCFNFITGDMTGKVLLLNPQERDEFEVSGYDTNSIAKLLLERIGWRCGVDEALDEFEIDKERCISEMEELLDDILYWK